MYNIIKKNVFISKSNEKILHWLIPTWDKTLNTFYNFSHFTFYERSRCSAPQNEPSSNEPSSNERIKCLQPFNPVRCKRFFINTIFFSIFPSDGRVGKWNSHFGFPFPYFSLPNSHYSEMEMQWYRWWQCLQNYIGPLFEIRQVTNLPSKVPLNEYTRMRFKQ